MGDPLATEHVGASTKSTRVLKLPSFVLKHKFVPRAVGRKKKSNLGSFLQLATEIYTRITFTETETDTMVKINIFVLNKPKDIGLDGSVGRALVRYP